MEVGPGVEAGPGMDASTISMATQQKTHNQPYMETALKGERGQEKLCCQERNREAGPALREGVKLELLPQGAAPTKHLPPHPPARGIIKTLIICSHGGIL